MLERHGGETLVSPIEGKVGWLSGPKQGLAKPRGVNSPLAGSNPAPTAKLSEQVVE